MNTTNPLVIVYSNGKWDGRLEHCQVAKGWYWGVPNEMGPHGPFHTKSLAESDAKVHYPNHQIHLGKLDPGYESTNS